MKKLFCLLFIITCASSFGTSAIFAQKRSQSLEVIVIEFKFAENGLIKREVPINRNLKIQNGIGGGMGNGGGVGCSHCSQVELEKLNKELKEEIQKESKFYTAEAWRINKNKSKLKFEISIKGGSCKAENTFIVYRNQQTKVQLDCGINLIAYYGFESKEAN